jgi:hypothetical protein
MFLFATVFLESKLGFSALLSVIRTSPSVLAMVFLYKRYYALKNQGAKARSNLDLSMPTRILAFGFYLTIALRYVIHRLQALGGI